MNGKGVAGFARPEYGDGVHDLVCDACGASWCGWHGDPCHWCQRSLQRLLDDQRNELLSPHWLQVDHGPRYDELAEVDRAVWDRTRGQASGAGSRAMWAARLARAVETGLITQDEADKALRRMEAA